MSVNPNKNKKNNNMLAGIVILVIIVLGIAYFLYSGSGVVGIVQNTTVNRSIATSTIISVQNKANNSSIAKTNSNLTTNKTEQKFSSSSIYNYAHLVAQNPYNSSINYIAAGAKVSEMNETNGSISINITEISDSQSKTIVLSKGESLYYSDMSYADDIPPSGEYSTIDDGLVVVNAQGFIVNQTTV